jgi:hypothetical protein
MNFNYTIAIQTGTGGVNENTSRWTGIIGELIDQVNSSGTCVLVKLTSYSYYTSHLLAIACGNYINFFDV